jgi:ABC-type glycerol-3-phosphate transport system permease component
MIRRLGSGLGVAAVLAAIAFPLYWAALGSVSPESQLHAGQRASLLPGALTGEHYRALFTERDFWTPIRNSLVVAASTTLVCVTLGAMCAYALARLRFRGKRLVLAAMIAIGMFPQIALVSPLFLILRGLGLLDSYPGLILPYVTFAMPLTVWLLVGTFRQLPADLEEAAMLDGASRLRMLWEIVLPLALPGIATTAILTFVYCWNEFLFALSFTSGPERQTVPVAVALFRGQHQVPWGEILAATVISSLPVIALVVAFQRRIVAGLTAGAGK